MFMTDPAAPHGARIRSFLLAILAAVAAPVLAAAQAQTAAKAQAETRTAPYAVVIANGRVMDPETGLDQIANVGIADGVIRRITSEPLAGRTVIDAKGLVVSPGFIDLHAHGQVKIAYELRARDGVTTALELESGVYPIAPFYAAREGRAPINFGASVSHQGIRQWVLAGFGQPDRVDRAASDAALRLKSVWAESPMKEPDLARALDLFSAEAVAGGLGLGFMPEYLPGTSRIEALRFMERAASLGVPVFTHVRASNTAEPGGQLEMMQEVIANAAATGVPLHICHVTSKGLNDTAVILEVIAGARRNGLDITTEAYPYTAGSTAIGNALFNDGWQQRFGADFSDIEWPATGERLTAETFARYRQEQPSTSVIFHVIPESAMDFAIAHPLVMIASDGGAYVGGYGHPRGAGTNARVLGTYVRERKVLTLMDALRKMTLMPAQRLEKFAPVMRRKGRLQEGMDADITIFDPQTVTDRAGYGKPTLPSEGIPYVLVNGVPVVSNSQIVPDALPGRGIRADVAASR
jgi:N-acyl-D-aspartate/D-glutamate deacylase